MYFTYTHHSTISRYVTKFSVSNTPSAPAFNSDYLNAEDTTKTGRFLPCIECNEGYELVDEYNAVIDNWYGSIGNGWDSNLNSTRCREKRDDLINDYTELENATKVERDALAVKNELALTTATADIAKLVATAVDLETGLAKAKRTHDAIIVKDYLVFMWVLLYVIIDYNWSFSLSGSSQPNCGRHCGG